MKPLFLCFSHNLNYALGWTVIHSLWQAFVITFAVGVLLIMLQQKTAKVRYMIAHAGLWVIFATALSTFCIYYDFSRPPSGLVVIPEIENLPSTLFVETTAQEDIASVTPPSFSWQGFKNYCNNNMYIIVTLWFMGVVVFLLKILGSISYVYYLRNRMNFPADEYWQETLDTLRKKINLNQYVELVESAFVRSPIVVGHLKPMILFPIGAINRLSNHEVEAILAHELAHILRHDYLYNIIQNVIEALFYYHPAVWWLSFQIRTERENCCDDVAISICGSAVTYAKSLVSVQEMAYYSPQLAMAFAGKSRKKQLLLRVQRILNQPKSTINIMEKFASTSILLLLLVGFLFGSNQLSATSFSNDSILGDNTEVIGNQSEMKFLKFEINGELDSIPVDKNMPDGHYSFVNNLYNVDMSVKNQKVVTFKINGLEVDKKDIPKFQKMINQLARKKDKSEDVMIAAPNQYFDNQVNGQLKNGKVKLIDTKGRKSELTISDKGAKHLIIDIPNREPVTVSLEDNGNIMIGGIISNLKSLNQLGWTINNNGFEPVDGFDNMSTIENEGEPACTSNSRKVDCDAKFLEQIQELREKSNELAQMGIPARKLMKSNRKLSQIENDLNSRKTPDYDVISDDLDVVEEELNDLEEDIDNQIDTKGDKGPKGSKGGLEWSYEDDGNGAHISSQKYKENKEKDFNAWLEKEWVKDGYSKKANEYRLQWTQDYMYVNKKKVSEEHLRKYIRMHKQITGSNLDSQFTITRISNGS